MKLAEDDRARVPFALVGVVLLVTSATFAATVGTQRPADTDARATEAVEEATAVARSALDRAVSRAGRSAARTPVVQPANTTVGAALNESAPFRDYLRVRAYLAARSALANATATVGDVSATVSLPTVSEAGGVQAAKRRVTLRSVPGERPRLAVTFRDLAVVVERDGRVVDRRRYSPTVTVETPVLALHDRVSAFERKLTRSPSEGGLAARLTGKLAAMAWARGLAQYGGAPIANVVATRHVEVATNSELLAVQRAAFGHSDPRGRDALVRASKAAGTRDFIAGVVDAEWTQDVLGSSGAEAANALVGLAARESVPLDRRDLAVGVNHTADDVFITVVDHELGTILDEVYSAEVHRQVRTRVLERETERHGEVPANWTLTGETRETTVDVEPTEASLPPPALPDGTHRLAGFTRTATTNTTVVRTWTDGEETRRTVSTRRTRHLVGVDVIGQHAATARAPRRGIEDPHSEGGPLDGQNFAGVRDRAVETLVADYGGVDRLVRRAVNGSAEDARATVAVPQPPGLEPWVYQDLAAVRERVRNVSVDASPRDALTGSPAERLANALRERRSDLVGAPDAYPSVAAKARVAARAAYVDAVIRAVEGHASNESALSDRLGSVLDDHGASLSPVLDGLSGPAAVDPADGHVVGIRGDPPYLTASVVGPEHSGAVDGPYYPLTTRNRNLFTAPYVDAADAVAEAVVPRGEETVDLETAARALRAANRTLREADNETLRRHRDVLRDEIGGALAEVAGDLRGTLVRRGFVTDHSAALAGVTGGLRQWETLHERALAAANGSLADAVAREVALPAGASGPSVVRDRLGVRLRLRLEAAVQSAEVSENETRAVAEAATTLARTAVAEGVRAAGSAARKRLVGAAAAAVPSGMPLLPYPTFWYATVNVWTVTVRGEYARFAVRAPASSPVPRRNVSYVREAEPVGLDVDGDGEPEHLGYNRPVSFAVRTAVPVVVPAGPPGVGDDRAVETSRGWPEPGPK